jgi:hypothetical protein
MAELNTITQQATTRAKDAAYVLVGLGVLGAQRVAVSGQELRSRLATGDVDQRVAEFRAQVAGYNAPIIKLAQEVDNRIEDAFVRLETTMKPVEDQLPAPAREFATKARSQARDLRSQVRDRVNTVTNVEPAHKASRTTAAKRAAAK